MESKVWLITGTSKGFGREWAEAALERGDKVAATARNLNSIKELQDKYGESVLQVQLDVNNREACFSAVEKTVSQFGRIDVLVSNAGYGHFGFIEELTEAETREQMETNFFGSLWVIQAALPFMRKQKSGHIIQVTSIGGVATFPIYGIYHASKWAMEGLCDTLSQEVAQFGIKVTLIEPGGYSTDWGTSSAKHSKPISAYEDLRKERQAFSANAPKGNPKATRNAILKIVDAPEPPLRLFLGSFPWQVIEPIYQKRLETWKEWQDVSNEAQG
ncbi:SDR family oxidoreductase [Lutibacter sp. B1]|uniref:SDR family oxidoreductase n=1 Tax=Lutibacter sp. B1 TaxID=2725996 RepID=UPI0014577A1D|nr:SDR family oxidoreductase [Lutibacter sp. B1]NLP57290.1 SDR family oxidoreductase [Lutibacter sp. B1]